MEKFVGLDMCSKQDEESSYRRDLLLKKLREKTEALSDTIPAHRNSNSAPLSSAQQQLWLISKFDSAASRSYHESVAFNVHGEFHIDAFSKSYQLVLQRHEVLNAVVRVSNSGGPYQLFDLNLPAEIELVDYSHVQDGGIKRNKFRDFLGAFSERDFDFHNDRLIRAAIVKMSEAHWSVVLVLHHIVMDGWSMGVLVRELSQFYNEQVTGQSNALPALDIQYGDFAIWQNNYFVGERYHKDILYWQDKLKSVENLDFPVDKVRLRSSGNTGGWVSFKIEYEVFSKLKLQGKKSKVTLYVILLSIYKILLFRHTGQNDLCVGSPVANRVRPEVENLIGLFVNTLALRSVIDPNESFLSVIDKVKATVTEAFKHQELPFEHVVSAVRPYRNNSIAPIFQTMFVLQNVSQSKLEFVGAEIEIEHTENIYNKFDISCCLTEISGDCLTGGIEYAADLFDRETMERFAQHFVELCKTAVAAPEKPIGDLKFLTGKEQYQLLVEWNDTAAPYPKEKCIQELFEEQVAKAPNAVAIVCEDKQLTYGELNARANQLAHYLMEKRDVKPDTLVGICVERSLEMIIGIMGILKAGGAYVPLDPDYPQSRLQYMLEDANLATVITQSHLKAKMQIAESCAVCIDDAGFQAELLTISADNIKPGSIGLVSSNLAYVIYTSGSTGKPKGVLIEHSGLCNLALAQQHVFAMEEHEVVLQFASLSFDAATSEIFVTLLAGSRLVVISSDILHSVELLSDTIQQKNVTLATLPPALLSTLFFKEWKSLKTIVVAGETISLVTANQWANNRKLINAYGPTEVTVCVSCANIAVDQQLIHIGKPLQNTQVYICDVNGAPVPVGVSGELHIGGVGLARGYLNRPDLTAEKFIANPFHNPANPASSERLYKTGDLCRYLPDGNIEFLGRIDHQVKIRGFRIELGEVESALISHELVRDAVVLARENALGEKQLVAFVVSGCTVQTADLKAYIGKQLPDYMLPSTFVVLDALPLTPNGKIDRKALESVSIELGSGTAYAAPRTRLEHQLAEIWARVLGADIGSIGIHDNFFELGGHSLLATRAVIQMRDQLKRDVSVRDLFESPTINSLAGALGSLSSEHQLPPIQVLDQRDRVVTSYAQERLWFLDQFEGVGGSYLVPAVYRLKGQLHVAALQRAYESLLSRHEILRTRIGITEQGTPCQVILTETQNRLAVYSLIATDEGPGVGFITDSNEFLKEFTGRSFKLADENLVRVALLEHSAEDYTLAIVMHHIITDGWSMGVFMQELFALYAAYDQGLENPLSPLAVQYADYSVWQREYLQGAVLETQSSYWKQQLQHIPLLELPTDRPRPPVQSNRGALLLLDIPQDIGSQLKAIGQLQGCTSFMTLLAVFNVLLHRYSHQNTLCVGTPIANRLQSEVEPLIGCFVNTLALRTDINSTETFTQLLQQIKETTLSAYEYQLIPFEKVVEVVQPERSQAYAPLFQAMLVLQNAQEAELNFSGVEMVQEGIEWRTSKFDLTLSLSEMSDGSLRGGIEYATDLFDESTIQRMATHFVELAKVLPASPDKAIGEVECLTVQERRQLVVEWNDTFAPYPKEKCIHELFEEQVAIAPDAVAVVFEDRQLTYGELNARANQLASYLIERRHVKPDTLVGICVERSLEMIVAILGILKAGGAYVPLDPDYPQSRLQYMLEDASLSTVITQRHLQENVQIDESCAVYIDSPKLQEELSIISTGNIVPSVIGLTSSHLAYVIYTSGSTGKPKGVMIEHKSLVNFAGTIEKSPGINKHDVLCAVTPVSFDIHALELFSPLSVGAKIALVNREVSANPDELVACLQSTNATVFQATPSTYKMLVDYGWSPISNIRLLCGGENLPAILNDALTGMTNVQLWNMYGPTETTVWSLIEQRLYKNPHSTIGKPLQNTQVYICDVNGAPVPVGVSGELHIGGVGLARGYLNRPDLTAEKFIANPFHNPANPASSERLYKTGDLCRYLPDGNIEFLGRIDHQVKIRGFRIELGEVESALISHELVRDAVVLARENALGEKQLVAFVVSGCTVQTADLKAYIGKQLPDYMLPSTFVVLDALPLTPNGKIDRKALESVSIELGSGTAYAAPRTRLEHQLAEIWARVLGADIGSIGIHDNFFELGGHSLLATRAVIQMRDQLKRDVSVRDLFESPTINSLAGALGSLSSEHQLPPIQVLDQRDRVVTSYAQERLWFLDQFEGVGGSYLVPAVYRLKGQLHVAALQRAYESLLSRHEILRTRIGITEQGTPCQVILTETQNRLAVYSLIATDEGPGVGFITDSNEFLKEFTGRSFKLADENLVRVALLEHSAEDYTLAIVMHHIITDGWSMGVFMQELFALYAAYDQGLENPLSPLAVQYADYSVWQREYLQGAVLETQSSYWKQQLQHIPLLELPTDRPRPPVQSNRGALLLLDIPQDIGSQLKAIGQLQGCTSFMTLLAVFNVLLHRYSHQNTLCVGTPIANRLQSEVEPLIGCFVNTLALRTDINSTETFTQLLQQIKETTLSAYEYQLIPFEKVVEVVQPERSQAYAPLFQAMLVLQNAQEAELNFSGVEMVQEGIEWRTSKFDLTLSLSEMSDGSLRGGIEYATDLFDESTIQRMATHFVELAKVLPASPDKAIGEVECLTVQERRQLVVEWNDTFAPYPKEKCIHELFEEQVAIAPDAVAVVFEDRQLTYGELNARANQLASYLIERRHVKPDTLVGICVERSLEMIVAILGILKAGGAYVPLDPDYPQSRLQYMLEDASLSTVITQRHLQENVQIDESCAVYIDSPKLQEELSIISTGNIVPSVIGLTSSHLAYVIYTSGSTGKPKGVMIEHGALHNTIFDNSQKFLLRKSSKFLHLLSFGFDAASWILWMTFYKGGALLLVKNVTNYLQELDSFDENLSPSHYMIPPSLLNIFPQHVFDKSKILILGGEKCSLELLNFWADKVNLYNAYGPTEASICASLCSVGNSKKINRSHIGKPIQNTQIYIFDVNGTLVPIGVSGELHIGGVGVARAYLNRPDLTAEKFIINPFHDSTNPASSECLYKTGDLCRYLPDGNIEFLGRIDHQVKIRGFRIELGEIEQALISLDCVKDAVVISRNHDLGEMQLISFLVINNEINVLDIKKQLGTTLPDYMIPSSFVVLDALPLTLNGKVDFNQLRTGEYTFIAADNYIPPKNIIERQLADLWAEILGVNAADIGVYHDFYELGGTSLALIKMMYLIKKSFNVDISVAKIMKSPCIADISNEISAISPKEPEILAGTSSLKNNYRNFYSKLNDAYLKVVYLHSNKISNTTISALSDESSSALLNVGCMVKPMLATIVMILSEEGYLDIDTPIVRYVPELIFCSDTTATKLTLKNLLLHSSGLDGTFLLDQSITDDIASTQDFIGVVNSLDCVCLPGSIFSYSSLDYLIAALVVEKVSGKPYVQVLKERLFDAMDLVEGFDYQISSPHYLQALSWVETGGFKSLSAASDCHDLLISNNAIAKFLKLSRNLEGDGNGYNILSGASIDFMQRRHLEVQYHPQILAVGIGWQYFTESVLGHTGKGLNSHHFCSLSKVSGDALYLASGRFPAFDVFDPILTDIYSEKIFFNVERHGEALINEKSLVGFYRCKVLDIQITYSDELRFLAAVNVLGESIHLNGTLVQIFRGIFLIKSASPIPFADKYIAFNWIGEEVCPSVIKVGKMTAYKHGHDNSGLV